MKKTFLLLNILICSIIILLNIFNFPMFYNSYGLQVSTKYTINLPETSNKSEIVQYFFDNNIPFGIEYFGKENTLDMFYTTDDILNEFMKNHHNFSIGYTNFQVNEFTKNNIEYNNISEIYTNKYDENLVQKYQVEYNDNKCNSRYFLVKLLINFGFIIIICWALQIIISKISFIKNRKKYLIFYMYSKQKLYIKHYLFDIISYWSIAFLLLILLIRPFIQEFNRYNIFFLILIIMQFLIIMIIKYIIFNINSKKLTKLNIKEEFANQTMSIGVNLHILLAIFSFIGIIILITLFNVLLIFSAQKYQINYIKDKFTDYTYISLMGVVNYNEKIEAFTKSKQDDILYSLYIPEENILYVSKGYLKKYFAEYDANCQGYIFANDNIDINSIFELQDIPQDKICKYTNNYDLVNIAKTYSGKIKINNPIIVVDKATSQFWIPTKMLPNNLKNLPIMTLSLDEFIYDTYINFIYPTMYQIIKMIIIIIIYIFILRNFYIYYWGKIKKEIICKLVIGQKYRKSLMIHAFLFQKYNLISIIIILFFKFEFIYLLLIIMILNYLTIYLYLKSQAQKELIQTLKE